MHRVSVHACALQVWELVDKRIFRQSVPARYRLTLSECCLRMLIPRLEHEVVLKSQKCRSTSHEYTRLYGTAVKVKCVRVCLATPVPTGFGKLNPPGFLATCCTKVEFCEWEIMVNLPSIPSLTNPQIPEITILSEVSWCCERNSSVFFNPKGTNICLEVCLKSEVSTLARWLVNADELGFSLSSA